LDGGAGGRSYTLYRDCSFVVPGATTTEQIPESRKEEREGELGPICRRGGEQEGNHGHSLALSLDLHTIIISHRKVLPRLHDPLVKGITARMLSFCSSCSSFHAGRLGADEPGGSLDMSYGTFLILLTHGSAVAPQGLPPYHEHQW